MTERFTGHWTPVILYAAAIFSVSSLQGKYVPSLFPGSDKVFHILEYMPFGFLVARAFDKTRRWGSLMTVFWITCLFVFLYGLSDEFHQIFVPGRDFSFVDLGADVIGAAAGGRLYLSWLK